MVDNPTKESYIDFSLERTNEEISWLEALEIDPVSVSSLTLWEKCKLILSESVNVPHPDIEIPLILGYAMIVRSRLRPLCHKVFRLPKRVKIGIFRSDNDLQAIYSRTIDGG